jgi:hypothetical protein
MDIKMPGPSQGGKYCCPGGIITKRNEWNLVETDV